MSYRLYEYDTDPTTGAVVDHPTEHDHVAAADHQGPPPRVPNKEYHIRRPTTMDSNSTVVALECVQHRLPTTTSTTTTTTSLVLLLRRLLQLPRLLYRNSRQLLSDLLLPHPQSVRVGYYQYQWYDSLQGLCSYLRNIVCSAALFQALAAVGSSMTPTTSSSDDVPTDDTMTSSSSSSSSSSVRHTAWNAAVVWAIRDGTGLVGGLLYTYLISRYLDAFVKEFRLFADVINDVGFTLDMILPYIEHGNNNNNSSSSSSSHSNLFWIVSSCSVLCKMMCGISAGATKSSITCHFAIQGNMADLNAKESTQETMVTLIGMVGGIYVAKFLQSLENDDDGTTTTGGHYSRTVTWIFFIVLTAIHLYANYLGVSLLRLRTINTSRIDPCLQHLLLVASSIDLPPPPWPVVTTAGTTTMTPLQQQQQYDALHSLLSTTILSPTDIKEIMFLPVWQFLGLLPSSLIYCNTIPSRQLAPYFHQSLLGQLMTQPPQSHADSQKKDNIPFERTIQSLRYNVTIMQGGDAGRNNNNNNNNNNNRNQKPKVAITLLAGATSNDELQAYLHAQIIQIRLVQPTASSPSTTTPHFDPQSDTTASHIRRVLLESYDMVQQFFQPAPNRSETEPSTPLIITVLQQKDWDTSRFYFNYPPSRCQLVVGVGNDTTTTDPNTSSWANKKDD